MAALELIMDEGVAHRMSKLVYVFVFDPHLLCDMHLSLVKWVISALVAPGSSKSSGLAAEMLLCATLQHVLEAVGN